LYTIFSYYNITLTWLFALLRGARRSVGTSAHHLPPELLIPIFQLAYSQESLARRRIITANNLRRVCKTWNSIICSHASHFYTPMFIRWDRPVHPLVKDVVSHGFLMGALIDTYILLGYAQAVRLEKPTSLCPPMAFSDYHSKPDRGRICDVPLQVTRTCVRSA
jgi:hypothetical protein